MSISQVIFNITYMIFFVQCLQPHRFAQIHDGVVECIAANSFVNGLFLSVGRNVLAIWSTELLSTPIFWRRNFANLTSVCWSKERPCVFYVTCADGSFEAWDILGKEQF